VNMNECFERTYHFLLQSRRMDHAKKATNAILIVSFMRGVIPLQGLYVS
jgi:hypothetical protein